MKNYKNLIILMIVSISQAFTVAASFQGIGLPPTGDKIIGGISNNYTIVGGHISNWVWADGVYSTVSDVPVGIRNISDDGSTMIAGDTYLQLGNPIYKIVNGITEVIPGYAPNTWTIAESVSADGSKIVGATRSDVPWVYENDSYTALPIPAGYTYGRARAISNDGSIIAGWIAGSYMSNTVIWTSSGIEILPNPLNMMFSAASIISGDGLTVVGSSHNDDFTLSQLSIWHNGSVEVLPMLTGVTSAVATAVSFDGSLVFGNSYDGGNAFVWDEVNGTRLLKDFLEDDYGLDLTGWDLQSVAATDTSGNIITGYGINPQGQEELWIATISEPATLLLLTLGGIIMSRKSKTRS